MDQPWKVTVLDTVRNALRWCVTIKKASGYTFRKITYWLTLLSFILPVGFLIYRIVVAENVATGEIGYRSRADYALMLVQCLLGAVVIHVPYFFRRYLKIEIPPLLYTMYIIFLYCAVFLGEVRSFYYRIPHWDKWLHGFSAVMAGSFGFTLVAVLSKSSRSSINLSPFFTTLFAFCFAISIGALWEIYEYTIDTILRLNMQKYMLEDGTELVGRAALNDTMMDIIIGCCGSAIASILGYISLKHRREKDLNQQTIVIEKADKKISC